MSQGGQRPSAVTVPRVVSSRTLADAVAVDIEALRREEACWIGTEPALSRQKKLERIVNSTALEVIVSLCVLADVTVTLATFLLPPDWAEAWSIFILSSLILLVLCIDVGLRAMTERLTFFRRPLNCLELAIAIAGVVALASEIRDRAKAGGHATSTNKFSVGRMIRPALRFFRILRVFLQVLFVRGGVKGRFDRQADKIVDKVVRRKMRELLLVPKQNVVIKPSEGTFHLEKAQIRSSVFAGVHLPLTVVGGIIDLMHVHVELSGIGPPGLDIHRQLHQKAQELRRGGAQKGAQKEEEEAQKDSHKLRVIIENVILVVGPGHHQEQGAEPWDFETVVQKKQQLVSLVTRGMDTLVKPKQKSSGGRRRQRHRVAQWLKNRAKAIADEIVAYGMLVNFRNVELRFEDSLSQLWGTHTAIGGVRLGALQLRAHGQTHADELHEEESFRSTGRWRPSISRAGDAVADQQAGVAPAEAAPPTKAGKFKAMKGQVASMLHLDGGTSSPSGSPRGSPRRSAKLKRSLKHGVRGALHVERLGVFWDHMLSSVSGEDAGRYSEQLKEGTGHNMHSFLESRWRGDVLERWRLAACAGMIRLGTGRIAPERIRKLRERVSSHRYLVLPFSFSLHASYKPQATKSKLAAIEAQTYWQPAVDVNVHMPAIVASIDLEMAASIMRLKDYIARWTYEDARFQWMVPPSHLGGGPVEDLWGFALKTVLHAIDKQHPWRTLAWILLRKRRAARSNYVEALSAWPKRDPHGQAQVLQVGLPLGEVFLARQEAASLYNAKRQEDRARRRARWKRWTRHLPKLPNAYPDDEEDHERNRRGSTDSGASGIVDMDGVVVVDGDDAVSIRPTDTDDTPKKRISRALSRISNFSSFGNRLAAMNRFRQFKSTTANSHGELSEAVEDMVAPKGPSDIRIRLAQIPMQLHLTLDTASMCVLLAPQGPTNRPLMRRRRMLGRVDCGSITVSAATSSPKPVWMHLAPPAVILNAASSSDPPDILAAMEASCANMTGVLGSTPSSAPQVRRMFGAARGSRREAILAAATRAKDGQQAVKPDPLLRWRGTLTMGEAEHNAKGKPKPPPCFVQFAMCVQPMEACGIKPLLLSTLRTLKSVDNPAGLPPRMVSKTSTRPSPTPMSSERGAKGRSTSPMSSGRGKVGKVPSLTGEPRDDSAFGVFDTSVFNSVMTNMFSSPRREVAAAAKVRVEVRPVREQTGEDIRRFWSDIASARQKLAEHRMFRRKIRKVEKRTGIDGPSRKILQGGDVTGQIHFVQGFRGTLYEPYSMGSWILKLVELPPGIVDVRHGGRPAVLSASFRSSSEAQGHRKGSQPVRAEDGWWFENELEAMAVAEAERLLTSPKQPEASPGRTSFTGTNGHGDGNGNGFHPPPPAALPPGQSHLQRRRDSTCAGDLAVEEPRLFQIDSKSSSTVAGSAFGAFGFSGGDSRFGSEVKVFSPRYKPSVSASGLPQLPEQPPMPPSVWNKKRTSRRSRQSAALIAPCDSQLLALCGNAGFSKPDVVQGAPPRPSLKFERAFGDAGPNVIYGTARHAEFAPVQVPSEVQVSFECRHAKSVGLPPPRALEAFWRELGLLRPRPDPRDL